MARPNPLFVTTLGRDSRKTKWIREESLGGGKLRRKKKKEKGRHRLSLEEGEKEEEKTEKKKVAKKRIIGIIGKGKMRRNGRRWIKKRKKEKKEKNEQEEELHSRSQVGSASQQGFILCFFGGGVPEKIPDDFPQKTIAFIDLLLSCELTRVIGVRMFFSQFLPFARVL